jgi:2-phosphosulfolactate phosphatase
MRLIRRSGPAGAENITGCVVVLDVIRASNTILGALENGAREVWLVGSLEQARALKRAHPAWELWGERGGVMVAGFQGDNSPAQARRRDLAGKSVVLTTSNGTRAATLLRRAALVFIGSLANAEALAEVLLALDPPQVTLLTAGRMDGCLAPEDELVAAHLQDLLSGRPSDGATVGRAIKGCVSAQRLRDLGQHEDLELCASPGPCRTVPVVELGPPARAFPWGRTPALGKDEE